MEHRRRRDQGPAEWTARRGRTHWQEAKDECSSETDHVDSLV